MNRITSRLNYGNVIATIALFVALGGTSYAAIHLPRNSVGRAQIKRHAVGSLQLGVHSVTASRVKPDSLGAGQINESKLAQVPSAHQADHAASADTATSASSAGNANTLGGLTATQLKDSCPAGTTPFAGECFETTQRAAQDWHHAAGVCADAGRHLPSAGEEDRFLTDKQITATEWTGDLADEANAISTLGGGGFNNEPRTNAEPFRCVASPTN